MCSLKEIVSSTAISEGSLAPVVNILAIFSNANIQKNKRIKYTTSRYQLSVIDFEMRLRLVYADGDAPATLLQPRRWSYAFDALLYPFYIRSEVHLIYVPLNVNDIRDQVAMLQLAIMNQDDWRSRQDVDGGPKGPRSVYDYPKTDGYNVGTMAT